MVAGTDQGDTFKRDMGYSTTEFFRILPAAVSGYDFSVEGTRVVVRPPGGDRRLVLIISELPERRLGMIRIPRIAVEFTFHNFSQQQRQEFLIAFDRSYQRGGG